MLGATIPNALLPCHNLFHRKCSWDFLTLYPLSENKSRPELDISWQMRSRDLRFKYPHRTHLVKVFLLLISFHTEDPWLHQQHSQHISVSGPLTSCSFKIHDGDMTMVYRPRGQQLDSLWRRGFPNEVTVCNPHCGVGGCVKYAIVMGHSDLCHTR